MPFRVSLFFSQQSEKLTGWSENFWNSALAGADIEPQVVALRSKLIFSKASQVNCPYGRISTADSFRQVKPLKFIASNTGTTPATPSGDADVPQTGLLLQFNGAPPNFTRQWFRGIEDRQISLSGTYNPVGAFTGWLNAFFAQLLKSGEGWAIRVLDPTVLPKTISTFASDTGIFTSVGLNADTDVTIRIKGAKTLRAANGLWRVTKLVPADTYQLQQWVPLAAGIPLGGHPTARRQVMVYQQITACSVIRATTHKAGRPFGLAGGRRKRRQTSVA